jgi:predicted RNase H-like HicB family nuclease
MKAIIFYSEEDQGYIAMTPGMLGLAAFGATPEEAEKELKIAKNAYDEVQNDDSKRNVDRR